MRILIDGKVYRDIRNINISSAVDITGSELTVNEYTAEIVTSDNIQIGRYAYLYDNSDVLIAKYWIVEAVRYSEESVSITAQSDIRLLGRSTISQEMFNHKNFVTAVNEIFGLYNAPAPQIDSALADIEVTGYCPEQTGRERIQWLCLYAGAYVRTDYTYVTRIEVLSEQAAVPILNDVVYYRPQVTYGDWVTGLKIATYSYTETYPSRTDDYIDVEGVYYVETVQYITIKNANAPAEAPENIIEFTDIKLINHDVAPDILQRLAKYYFRRVECSADVINNGEFKAGDNCILDMGTGEIITGYINNSEFSFGNTTKTTLTIGQAETAEGVELIIKGLYGETVLTQSVYFMPSGSAYSIQNKYIDKSGFEIDEEGEKIFAKTVYMPQNANATGTVGSETTINEQQYEIALRKVHGDLSVYAVDQISGGGTVKIG